MGRLYEVETEPSSSEGEYEYRRAGRIEPRNFGLPFARREGAMEERDPRRKELFEFRLEGDRDFRVLREDEDAFARRDDFTGQIGEPRELALAVADELEPREERENVAMRVFAVLPDIERGFVFRPVTQRERAVFANLALLAKLGRDSLVALQSPQDERFERVAESLRGG